MLSSVSTLKHQKKKESSKNKKRVEKCVRNSKFIYNSTPRMNHLHMNGKWWVSSLIALVAFAHPIQFELRGDFVPRKNKKNFKISASHGGLQLCKQKSCGRLWWTFFSPSNINSTTTRVWFSNKFNYCPKSYNYILWFSQLSVPHPKSIKKSFYVKFKICVPF